MGTRGVSHTLIGSPLARDHIRDHKEKKLQIKTK